MNVIVNSLLTNYRLAGKGRLVLLLHGWGDSIKGLSGLQKALAADYQVLALDLPGFGASQAPDGVWSLDDYGAFVAAFLKKIDAGQPYGVVGHSNGGALAIRAVSLGQLKPRKLVLLAASGVRTNHKAKRLLLKAVAKTGNAATLWMPEQRRRGLREKLYGAAGSDMLAVPDLQETFKKTVRQDVQGDAARITVPALLVYADNDKAIPLADGKQYHSLIKGSKLEVLKGAGHFLHLEHPEKVAKLVKEFLA